MTSILLTATEILTYLPEGIFGLIIILLVIAIRELWQKINKKEDSIAILNREHTKQMAAKDQLYKEALEHVLLGLKESNEIVHKITMNISTMNKPLREDIADHDKRIYTLVTEIKSLIK